MYTWSRTHTYTLIASLLLVGVFVFLPDIVSAQGATGGAAPAPTPSGTTTFIQQVLWAVIAGVFGFLVWVTGGFLDWTITTLIVGFGTLFQSSGLGVAVNTLWTIVRDLFNLTFIFGLIFIGFKMILDSNDSGAKKAIGNLIIAALLVNFSLFITKTVIDFSNIAATQIAQVIYRSNSPSGNPISISQVFATNMGLPTIWGEGSNAGAVVSGTDPNSAPPGGWTYIFGSMFIFVIAAFCFMAGAVLIAIRFVTLVFLMVLSPIMFLGRVFSPLEGESKKFMRKLLSASFFAPAFLLMIYFSLYILGVFTGGFRQPGSTLYSALNDPNAAGGSIAAIAGFLMAGGFLIGSVLVANKIGATGAGTAISIGNKLRGQGQRLVGSMTLGASARLGQRTIGQASQRLADSEKMTNWKTKSSLGRAAFAATKSVGDASFDGRKALTAVGVKELGSGTKGGYATRLKESADAEKKFVESLGERKLPDASTREGAKKREEALQPVIEKIRANQTEGTVGYKLKEATEAEARATAARDAAKNKAEATGASKEDVAKTIQGEEAALKKAQQAKAALEKDLKQEAEARYTYGRQLDVLARRTKTRDRIVAASKAGLFAGVVPGIVGASYGAQYDARIEAIEKAYGKDGMKKVTSKKRKNDATLLAEVLKDEGVLPEEKK